MNPEITRLLGKLLNNPIATAESVIAPLLGYLGGVLSSVYPVMLKPNFLRFLEVLWLNILDQVLVVTLNNRSVRNNLSTLVQRLCGRNKTTKFYYVTEDQENSIVRESGTK